MQDLPAVRRNREISRFASAAFGTKGGNARRFSLAWSLCHTAEENMPMNRRDRDLDTLVGFLKRGFPEVLAFTEDALQITTLIGLTSCGLENKVLE